MKYYLLLITITLSIFSCDKDCNDGRGGYDFQVPATLSPAKITYKIGDTISISSTFSNNVLDRTRDKTFVLDNFDFDVHTTIFKVDTSNFVQQVAEQFEILAEEQFGITVKTRSDGTQFIVGNINYEDSMYSVAYKFVAKEPGLFYFRLGTGPFFNRTFDGICERQGNTIGGFVMLNEGADNNIDLLRESPDSSLVSNILSKPVERFQRFGGYVFRVEE